MSLASDHQLSLDGNVVTFFKSDSESRNLQPGQTLSVPIDIVGGKIEMTVKSLDFHEPFRVQQVGGHPDPEAEEGPGSMIEEMQYVPVRVDLLPPDSSGIPLPVPDRGDPGMSWTTPSGWHRVGAIDERPKIYDTGPLGRTPRTWTCRVTNTSDRVAACSVSVYASFGSQPLRIGTIPVRVLNHAFKVALDVLAPRVELGGNNLIIGFGEELAAYLEEIDAPFGQHEIPLPEGVEGQGRLLSIDVAVGSGQLLLDAVVARWQTNKDALEEQLRNATGLIRQALERELQKNDEWKADWERKVQPDFVTLHIQALATTLSATYEIWGLDIPVATISDASIQIYLAFNPYIASQPLLPGASVLVLSPTKYTGGLADIMEDLGIMPEASRSLESYLGPALEELRESPPPPPGGVHAPARSISYYIGRYLAEVLVRLLSGGGVFLGAEAVGEQSLRIRYCQEPGPEGGVIGRPDSGIEPIVAPIEEVESPVGEIPESFVIRNPETLELLDQIQTIVVVMMENRSFDHMLGYLRMSSRDDVEGLDETMSNPPPPNSTGNILVQSASDFPALSRGVVTQIKVSLHHNSDHVIAQIADGAMDGFVKDNADLTDNNIELPMLYYTGEELPVHYRLATEFRVCDHWFCAHVGPTWPNRWATIMGMIPELDNLDIDDPRIGFMPQFTIFDLLRSLPSPVPGIDFFRCFESDVTMLRMFNSFRLDDRYVVPYDDPNDGFETLARRGALPPVVFVDPNFVDLPPIWMANDDHAPADLRGGQEFLARIFNALVGSPQWPNTLLLITYDEHGGFFDHVPPPGTAAGPAEWVGAVPKMHSEGADYMGPRVPTLVISPWVGAGGEPSKVIFDHTSILKTILVRHRRQIREMDFVRFGERVNTANHLGSALQTEARTGRPGLFDLESLRRAARSARPVQDTTRRATPTRPGDGDRRDYHASLCRMGLPRLRPR